MQARQDARIVCVEWATLSGRRPRPAGSNARLGDHGAVVRVPIVRLHADDGSAGFGLGRPSPELAGSLRGRGLSDLFVSGAGVPEPWRRVENAVWDLVGQRTNTPVYALAAASNGKTVPQPYRVPCYDTSQYFDDLLCGTDEDAAALIAAEAREGYDCGHRAFKIKVGRGHATWMSRPGRGATSRSCTPCARQ